MKPRLSPLPLTDEDRFVWALVWTRSAGMLSLDNYSLWREAARADRRDAEVMYRLGNIRQRFAVASIMMLGADKPTAPGILAAGCRSGRDPGRSFELDYRQ